MYGSAIGGKKKKDSIRRILSSGVEWQVKSNETGREREKEREKEKAEEKKMKHSRKERVGEEEKKKADRS